MAKGKLQGPLGPIMLAMLLGLAGFMLFVANNPEMAEHFQRPEGFYDNTFERIGLALVFAISVAAVIALIRKPKK